jgi:CP family cyanate transporter-like MFS transporter
VVLAFNLRPAAVSVGPVLHAAQEGLGMSATVAGVLTSLPVLAFAVFGALAPRIAHVVGVHRTSFLALLGVVLGLGVRPLVDSVPLFLALSVVALSGMAAANVLLPSLVKLHFPDRIGLLTSLYTTSMAIGVTASSVLTVPLSDGFGSWRWGLFSWATTAAIAAVPWVALLRHDSAEETPRRTLTLGDVARTPLGWAMAACFGLQSLQAYAAFGWFPQLFQDAGYSARDAGLLVGLLTAMSIPISFWIPHLAARLTRQTPLFAGLIAAYVVGYVGLLVAPYQGAVAWAALVGVGAGVFPLVLTLIGLRSRTSEGTAALSGFTQGAGYLLAAVGPFGVGVLLDRTGGWTAPLVFLILLLVPLALAAGYVSRPRSVEDQIARR